MIRLRNRSAKLLLDSYLPVDFKQRVCGFFQHSSFSMVDCDNPTGAGNLAVKLRCTKCDYTTRWVPVNTDGKKYALLVRE